MANKKPSKTAKPKKKLTPNQQEYEKQLKRIDRILKKGLKLGYFWTETPVPERPKRITKKAIATLKSLTPTALYSTAYYRTEHGEVIQGKINLSGVKQEEVKGLKKDKRFEPEPNNKGKKRKGQKVGSINNHSGKKKPAPNTPPKQNAKKPKKPRPPQQTPEKPKQDTDIPQLPPPDDNLVPATNEDFFDATKWYESDERWADKGADEEPERDYTVIYKVLEEISRFTPDMGETPYMIEFHLENQNLLSDLLQSAIDTEGFTAVAERLERYGESIIAVVAEALRSSDREVVEADLHTFATAIYGGAMPMDVNAGLTDLAEAVNFTPGV